MDGCLRSWKSLGVDLKHFALPWKKGIFAETVVAMHLAKAVETAHWVA
jgi:hypothetical protein